MGKQYDYQDSEENQQWQPSSRVSEKLTYLLVGGGIGAVMALLFAPKSGTELRGDLADAGKKGYDRTRETAQQLKEKSGTYVESARQAAGDVYNRAGGALSAAKEQFSRSGEKAGETLSQSGERALGSGSGSTGNQTGNSSDKSLNQSPSGIDRTTDEAGTSKSNSPSA
jgi:gas vesicle protein